ncbi:MAG: ROK family glucokinase [Lachnospiraceae bacterium]|nr:ROK family glucokinase [Lachnospiraceae bacterium]
MDSFCFGVDVGGTTVKIGLFDRDGKLLDKWEIPTDLSDSGKNILPDIAESLLKKMDEKGITKEAVFGVGIGVPGPVTPDGTVVKGTNLGWGVFNVKEALHDLTGIECFATNDANAAALGEMRMGGGKGLSSGVFITLGTGVGGGIIVDGKVRNGARGGCGEIGHICVNPDETEICGCGGHGHLEQYASATGLVRLAVKRLEESDEETSLRGYEKLTAKDVFDEAKKGDKVADELVETMCRYLGMALSGVGAALDPDGYVIGGGVSRAGTIITDRVKKYLDNHIGVLRGRDVMLATLGNDAGICGAAALCLFDLQGR